jgi:hypothetical protein
MFNLLSQSGNEIKVILHDLLGRNYMLKSPY